MDTIVITVFTATYNRANLLKRVYKSLTVQSYTDFEWLIIDDGSTDETQQVVSEFLSEEKVLINYFKKENGGKHSAWNFGLERARGEFFLILDDDDVLPPLSLERFGSHYEKIKEIPKVAGITALCADFSGKIIGDKFPQNGMVGRPQFIYHENKIYGDKCGGYKLNILREFPFPIFDGEKFLTEAIVLNQIEAEYDNLFVNEVLCQIEYQSDGLSSNSVRLRVENPRGASAYYLMSYTNSVNRKERIKSLINYLRFTFHQHESLVKNCANVSTWCKMLLSPVAYLLYKKDLWKLRK